jgi:hypothetical protein
MRIIACAVRFSSMLHVEVSISEITLRRTKFERNE